MFTQDEIYKALEEKQGERTGAFREAHVAICGIGGLGSNVAMMLARSGVGHLSLIDSDLVEITNLHRQAYKASQVGMPKTAALKANILEAAPYAETELHMNRLCSANLADLLQEAETGTNVVVECLDGAEDKAMLCNFVLENMPGTYLVAASGMAGDGSGNSIRTRKVSRRFYLCGDETSDTDGNILLGPRVMICAAHEAMAVLEILAKNAGRQA